MSVCRAFTGKEYASRENPSFIIFEVGDVCFLRYQ